MTTLKPSHEQLVHEALSSGHYRDVNEFLDEALSAWKTKSDARGYDLQPPRSRADVLPVLAGLMEQHRLTSYDAAYLEPVIRRKLTLATLDKTLIEAYGVSGQALV